MSEKKKKGYVVGALFQDKAVTKNSLIIPAVLVGGRKKKHTEGRNVYMGVRVVIPNMSKTFGAFTMPAKAKRSHGTSMEKMSKEISTRSLPTHSAGKL